VKCLFCKDTGIIKGEDLGLDWSRWCSCEVGEEAAQRITKQVEISRLAAQTTQGVPGGAPLLFVVAGLSESTGE